jgi:hypothetical protein
VSRRARHGRDSTGAAQATLRSRARHDFSRERHTNQQHRYGFAEDDRYHLKVVQVQDRRSGEGGGQHQIEKDVNPLRNDPQGRERPLAHESESSCDRARNHHDYRRATTQVDAHHDKSGS